MNYTMDLTKFTPLELRNVKECYMLASDKRIFSEKEWEFLLSLYNRTFKENKKLTGCGRCRRGIINPLRKLRNEIIDHENETN